MDGQEAQAGLVACLFDPMSCIFCEIIAGESPARIILRDPLVTAIHDTHPVAKTHILIIPNRHISSVNELEAGDEALMGHMLMVAKNLAEQAGVAESGYRLLINTGAHAGQSVFHLHLHLIGGALARFVVQ